MKKIYKIVLTGGPSGGKTSAISRIVSELSERGYYTFIIPESATELIPNGIKVGKDGLSPVEFQNILMRKQIFKENLYMQAAKIVNAENVVIILDRGILDSKAYVSKSEFEEIMTGLNEDVYKLAYSYDGVIHLVTAADGAENYYTTLNNVARTETKEEAKELDKRTLNSWLGIEKFYVVGNENVKSFAEKLDKVMETVYFILGQPVPIDIQYKYLVKMPDIEYIKGISFKTLITQTYLQLTAFGEEVKIKKVESEFSKSYYLVKKSFRSGGKVVKKSEIITDEEAQNLLFDTYGNDEQRVCENTNVKERYFFVYNNQYFNLDVYPFSKDKAILEMHLTTQKVEVQLPDFIDIIKDVTDDNNYHNVSITAHKRI